MCTFLESAIGTIVKLNCGVVNLDCILKIRAVDDALGHLQRCLFERIEESVAFSFSKDRC
jgi:hypothetical protein